MAYFLKKQENKVDNNVVDVSSKDYFAKTYIQEPNMIYRADGKPISDEEVPFLIKYVEQNLDKSN